MKVTFSAPVQVGPVVHPSACTVGTGSFPGLSYRGSANLERKIFRRIYGPEYENGEWKSRTNREIEEMSKGENIVKMDKRAKDKLVRSPRENGGG